MKTTIFFVLSTFYIIQLNAQNTVTDSTATLVAYWEKGDSKTLKIERYKAKYSDGKNTNVSEIKYGASIKVLNATDSSYTLVWKYLPPTDLNKMEVVDPYYQLFTDTEIHYQTDENGSFDSLLNYDKIQEIIKKSIDYLSNLVATKNPEVAKLDMMKNLLDMFNNREMIEQIVLKDIAILHNYYGILYKKNKPDQYDILLNNFLGGDPFPATISLQYVGKTGDDVNISSDQYLDKEKTLPILVESFKKLSKEVGEELSKSQDSFKNFEMMDKTNIIFSQESGWIKKIVNDKSVNIDQSKNIEKAIMIIN